MKWVPGGDFGSAWARHAEHTFDCVVVRVVDVDTLIELKEASGRPIDLEDARVLRALRGG